METADKSPPGDLDDELEAGNLGTRTLDPKPLDTAAIRKALGKRSIVLVGMMGAGKSSVGRRLASSVLQGGCRKNGEDLPDCTYRRQLYRSQAGDPGDRFSR